MISCFDKRIYMDIRDGNIVSTEEKRLTLAYEGIVDVPSNLVNDYGEVVEILDLSYNKLTNVDFLSSFKKLSTIILDHNHLTPDTIFPQNPNVTTVWLNHNFIDKLHPIVHRLSKAYRNLKFLSLMGNAGAPSYLNGGTYYEYIQYRLFVISCIPQLEYLDDRIITADQRAEANRLYGKSFYKMLIDEQIPEFMEKFMRKMKISLGVEPESTPAGGDEESVNAYDISNNPNGSRSNTNCLTSIPVSTMPVSLNSSDSESSLSIPKRKYRNLVI